MKTTDIAKGSLAVALCLVSLMMFKGYLNILNAFFIPLVLATFCTDMKGKERIIVYSALLLFCLAIFPVQVVFVFFYSVIAFSIVFYSNKNLRKIYIWLLLSFQTTLFFAAAILLTDAVFSTKMFDIMLNMTKGNVPAVFLIILLEATFIVALQLIFYKKVTFLIHRQSKKV